MSLNINNNPYKTRIGGSTCTVFVPYNCNNNCPFCINKKEYADTTSFSLDNIIKSIKKIDELTPQCDFVLTGGEPFANLESLQKLLDAIPISHKIYINTTLPTSKTIKNTDILKFINFNKSKITCLNISRHIDKYIEESPDEFLSSIQIKKRINCVLYNPCDDMEKMREFVERFGKYAIPIQFRYDYTTTTTENLYGEENDIHLHNLKKLFIYIGLDGCRMRNGFHFKYYIEKQHNWEKITYHKTLPYSTITEKDKSDGITYDILYDIIIKQNGSIHSDWDGTPLDIEKYKNVKYEPYDLKFIYKNEKEWID